MINHSKTIDFFIGLPGSGKTYAAQNLIKILKNENTNIINNENTNIINENIHHVQCNTILNNIFEDNIKQLENPTLQHLVPSILFVDDLYIALQENKFNWQQLFLTDINLEPDHIVITDFLACDPKQQNFIYQQLKDIFPEHKQHWVFFDNNIEQCLKNIKQRNNGKAVHVTLAQMNKIYGIDPDLINKVDSLQQLPVYSPDFSNTSKFRY